MTGSEAQLVDFIVSVTFNLWVMLVGLYLRCLFCCRRLLSTFWIGSSVWSWSHIFHIGTVIPVDASLACRTLWYIPIFHRVAHANIFGADCSTISSKGIAKYLDSCSGRTNVFSEYKSVTVRVASVILAIRCCPLMGWWRSVLRSNHNSLMITVIALNTLWKTSALCFFGFCCSSSCPSRISSCAYWCIQRLWCITHLAVKLHLKSSHPNLMVDDGGYYKELGGPKDRLATQPTVWLYDTLVGYRVLYTYSYICTILSTLTFISISFWSNWKSLSLHLIPSCIISLLPTD